MLHQYYNIREQEFKSVYGAKNFKGEETEFDRDGEILIVRKGNQCVGGARLFISTPRLRKKLPLEINDFSLDKYFPKLKQKEMIYAQASGFTLLEEFRGGDVTRMLFNRLYNRVVALGGDMIFAAPPILNARVYKQNCIAMGLQNVKIHNDIELPRFPTYEEVKCYLMSGVIDKVIVRKSREGTIFYSNLETIY